MRSPPRAAYEGAIYRARVCCVLVVPFACLCACVCVCPRGNLFGMLVGIVLPVVPNWKFDGSSTELPIFP